MHAPISSPCVSFLVLILACSEKYPVTKKAGMTYRVIFPTEYTAAEADGIQISFSLKAPATGWVEVLVVMMI